MYLPAMDIIEIYFDRYIFSTFEVCNVQKKILFNQILIHTILIVNKLREILLGISCFSGFSYFSERDFVILKMVIFSKSWVVGTFQIFKFHEK